VKATGGDGDDGRHRRQWKKATVQATVQATVREATAKKGGEGDGEGDGEEGRRRQRTATPLIPWTTGRASATWHCTAKAEEQAEDAGRGQQSRQERPDTGDDAVKAAKAAD